MNATSEFNAAIYARLIKGKNIKPSNEVERKYHDALRAGDTSAAERIAREALKAGLKIGDWR